jgi:NAD(P)-dependent dehydrogenase (short-subunit alcohol dehydrogenase family)
MAVNVKSTFFACREVVEVMRRGGGGNVLLIGSVDGLKRVPAPVHYAATKGALGAMVRAMAKEVGTDGIRVNLVAPGVLEGGLSRTLPPSLRADYLRHCGLRRLGTMDEVARLVAWLALENTYLSGQTLAVDGAL